MRFNSRQAALLETPDLPINAFQHSGDRKIQPQGGGIPIVSDVVDIVGDVVGGVVDAAVDVVNAVPGVGDIADDVLGLDPNGGGIVPVIKGVATGVVLSPVGGFLGGAINTGLGLGLGTAGQAALGGAAFGAATGGAQGAVYGAAGGYIGSVASEWVNNQLNTTTQLYDDGSELTYDTRTGMPISGRDINGAAFSVTNGQATYTTGNQAGQPLGGTAETNFGGGGSSYTSPSEISRVVTTNEFGVPGVQVTTSDGSSWFEPQQNWWENQVNTPATNVQGPVIPGTAANTLGDFRNQWEYNTATNNGFTNRAEWLQADGYGIGNKADWDAFKLANRIGVPSDTIPVTLSNGQTAYLQPGTNTVYNPDGTVNTFETYQTQQAAGNLPTGGTQVAGGNIIGTDASGNPILEPVVTTPTQPSTPGEGLGGRGTQGLGVDANGDIIDTITGENLGNAGSNGLTQNPDGSWADSTGTSIPPITTTTPTTTPTVPVTPGDVGGAVGAVIGTTPTTPSDTTPTAPETGATGPVTPETGATGPTVPDTGATGPTTPTDGTGTGATGPIVPDDGTGTGATGIGATGPVTPGDGTGGATGASGSDIGTGTGGVGTGDGTGGTGGGGQGGATGPVTPDTGATGIGATGPITPDTGATGPGASGATGASGVVIVPVPIPETPEPPPPRTPFPIPTYYGTGLVNPGVNPGWIEPAPPYRPQQPGVDEYFWGPHLYAQNMSDLARLNQPAPAQPYGNPNAVNLGRITAYTGPAASYQTGVPFNAPAPAVPGYPSAFYAPTPEQMARGQGYAQQYGQSLNYVPYPIATITPAYPVAPATDTTASDAGTAST